MFLHFSLAGCLLVLLSCASTAQVLRSKIVTFAPPFARRSAVVFCARRMPTTWIPAPVLAVERISVTKVAIGSQFDLATLVTLITSVPSITCPE